ncbi:DUF1685 family protein [Quillaja saponaria]|uniref:DUF1685 family protein n=1 Tax=Quillaja saponaria TaxID=32244 RepID=A0AAD7KYW4_QUISA|nr:DUF1685 family protein [Quillaja saponaria]
MAAQEILKLFDSYWFETTIFTKTPTSPSLSNPITQTQPQILAQESKLLKIPSLRVRSLSDQNLTIKTSFLSDSLSTNSDLLTPKLQTILSGEVVEAEAGDEEEIPTKKKVNRRRRSRKIKRSSKSLSELEFKEVKGFMDLGFVFSEEDKDSKLVSLIPGLQRFGKFESGEVLEGKNEIDEETEISRPYLSEAWGVLDENKLKNPLMNWRIPALGTDEIDMKDHLKFWAHTVASTVR